MYNIEVDKLSETLKKNRLQNQTPWIQNPASSFPVLPWASYLTFTGKETYGAVYLWSRFIWLTKEPGIQFAISIFGTKYFKFRNLLDMLISILHSVSC